MQLILFVLSRRLGVRKDAWHIIYQKYVFFEKPDWFALCLWELLNSNIKWKSSLQKSHVATQIGTIHYSWDKLTERIWNQMQFLLLANFGLHKRTIKPIYCIFSVFLYQAFIGMSTWTNKKHISNRAVSAWLLNNVKHDSGTKSPFSLL